MHTLRRYLATRATTCFGLALAGMFAAGCHGPSGALLPYTGASQTLVSTETSPKTFTLVDTRTNEVVFEIAIPPGRQLTYDFIEDGGDDPVLRPSYMRYELFPAGTRYGKMRNGVPVPGKSSRRVDWYIREGTEYKPEPPEYRYRIDELTDRPDWWSPEGGPMPDSGKTTGYDN